MSTMTEPGRLVAERISDRRRSLRMSQRDLAKAVGVSQGMIVAYEKGTTDLPVSRVEELARALNTSIAYLFGETDDPAPLAPLRGQRASVDILRSLSPTERLMLEAAGRRLAEDLLREAREVEDDKEPG